MHQGDRERALADGGGDPLDRFGAYVPGGEDARDGCLEQIGIPVQVPGPRPGAARSQDFLYDEDGLPR